MKKSGVADQIKAVVLAAGLSILPAKEVNSGVSVGGKIGFGFNGDISAGVQAVLTDKPNSFGVKAGVDYNLAGENKGDVKAGLGVAYLTSNGFTISGEGNYNLQAKKSPFSFGVGLGFGNVKKNLGVDVVDEELGAECGYNVVKDKWINRGGLCEERCEDTGGTWKDGNCYCPENLYVDGTCGYAN